MSLLDIYVGGLIKNPNSALFFTMHNPTLAPYEFDKKVANSLWRMSHFRGTSRIGDLISVNFFKR